MRCVSISLSDFDTHSNNFPRLQAAVADSRSRPGDAACRPGRARHAGRCFDRRLGRVRPHAEGQSPRTAAAITGPPSAWRCWPAAACTPARSSAKPTATPPPPSAGPIHYQDVFATLYHNLGINARARHHHRPHRPAAISARPGRSDSGVSLNLCLFVRPFAKVSQ